MLPRRIPTLLAVLAGLALTISAAPASAAAASTAGSVQAGDSAYMRVTLAAPALQCQLVASTPGRTTTLSSFVPSSLNIEWVWQVPADARTADWRLQATCGSNQVTAQLAVRGASQPGVLALATQLRVLQFGGVMPSVAQLPSTLARSVAASWWQRNANKILSSFHSGAAAGQCTDLVAAHRPDVIQAVDVWAYSQSLRIGGGALNVDWTAKYWAINARRAGVRTGHRPRAGAVIVFQPGAYGAFSDGHVAVVERVGRDGSFTISEMHAPLIGRISSRRFSAAVTAAMAHDSRVTFIYR